MKSLLRFVASAAMSLMLVTGVSLSLTGCSADTLSGPNFDSYAETGGGTSGGSGSEHNYDKTESGGGTSGGSGSEHNYDD